MEDKLFDTEEKRENAIAAFEGLKQHPGWTLIVKILNSNLEVLREQLENNAEDEETMEDIRVIRSNIKLVKELRDTPDIQIKNLKKTEDKVPNPDPFPTKEELAKERA